jgi:hypothetical protein
MPNFAWISRIILGVYIIALGLEQIYEAGINQKFVPDSLDFISNIIHFPLESLKIFCMELIYIENILFINSGLLLVFGFNLAKLSLFLGILLDMLLINNVFIIKEQNTLKKISTLISIYGGLVNSF